MRHKYPELFHDNEAYFDNLKMRRWINEPKKDWLTSPFAGASLKHGPHMVSNY